MKFLKIILAPFNKNKYITWPSQIFLKLLNHYQQWDISHRQVLFIYWDAIHLGSDTQNHLQGLDALLLTHHRVGHPYISFGTEGIRLPLPVASPLPTLAPSTSGLTDSHCCRRSAHAPSSVWAASLTPQSGLKASLWNHTAPVSSLHLRTCKSYYNHPLLVCILSWTACNLRAGTHSCACIVCTSIT